MAEPPKDQNKKKKDIKSKTKTKSKAKTKPKRKTKPPSKVFGNGHEKMIRTIQLVGPGKNWREKRIPRTHRMMESEPMRRMRIEEMEKEEEFEYVEEVVYPEEEEKMKKMEKMEKLEDMKELLDDHFIHADCLQLPVRIGDFYLTHKIGQGSFARVYIAHPIHDKQCVAVKVKKNWYPEDMYNDGDNGKTERKKAGKEKKDEKTVKSERCDFQMEVEVLRNIHRCGRVPHVPELLHYNRDPPIHYMTLTLFGLTLRELKLKTPDRCLERGTLARIGIQVLYALKTCHDAGFVHRDVKPANLMIGGVNDLKRRRVVHLIDFGIAKRWAVRIPDEDDRKAGGKDDGKEKKKEKKEEKKEDKKEKKEDNKDNKKEDKKEDKKDQKDKNKEPEEPKNPKKIDPGAEPNDEKEAKVPIEEKWAALPLRTKVHFRGSLRYASPNMHRRMEQGRVDDIWSLLFTLIDLGGQVPWAGETSSQKVFEMKKNVVGWMRGQPRQWQRLVEHLLEVETLQRPNYHLIFNAFYSTMRAAGETPSSPYTWEELPPSKKAKRVKQEWHDPKGTFFQIDYLGINGPENVIAPWESTEIDKLADKVQSERMQMHPGRKQAKIRSDKFLNAKYEHFEQRQHNVFRRYRKIGRHDYDAIEIERRLDIDTNHLDKYKGEFDLEKAACSDKYDRLDFGWMNFKKDEVKDEKK